MCENFDLIVIGGGPGGHALAEDAAIYGARVCVIEKSGWGGTCTHRGCVPTKALLTCSRRWMELKKMKRFGISISHETFDFKAMKRHQQQMIKVSALGVEKSLQKAGVDLKMGEAVLTDSNRVRWQSPTGANRMLKARNICIAWGSKPATLPNVPLSARVLTSDEFLNLEDLPRRVIIIGGSVIGVEFATMLAELGVHVTIIEICDSLLPLEDEEAVSLIKKELTLLGVVMRTATSVTEVNEKPDAVQVSAKNADSLIGMEADYVLMCTGRNPRLYPDQLDALGIQYDEKGIRVDIHQETSLPGIYAIGDVTGGMMLAHRAMQQGKALASCLFGNEMVSCRENAIPSVVYSHPPIARVGLTQKQAKTMGLDTESVKLDYGANIMARTELAGQGFAKLLFHKQKIIGACIAGEQAGELIASLSLAVYENMDKKTLTDWVKPHPTLSEILNINRPIK